MEWHILEKKKAPRGGAFIFMMINAYFNIIQR